MQLVQTMIYGKLSTIESNQNKAAEETRSEEVKEER